MTAVETAVADAIAADRALTIAYARGFARQVRNQHARGRLTAAEAEQLARRVDAFADGLAAGLHLPDEYRAGGE